MGLDSELVVVEANRFYTGSSGQVKVTNLVADETPTVRRWLARLRFMRQAAATYDVFHFNKGETFIPGSLPFVFDLWWLRRKGKRTTVTFQGSDARPHMVGAPRTRRVPTVVTNWIKRMRIRQIVRWADATFCLNPDLLQQVPGSTFLPYASVDPSRLTPSPKPEPGDGRVFRVIHAPTNRTLKGTEAIIEAVHEAAGSVEIELDLVENVHHDQVVERIRRADLAIDQLVLGWYGGFAVECMALGTPVVAWLDPSHLAAAPDALAQNMPVLSVRGDDLGATLTTLASEAGAAQRSIAASSGRTFVTSWHTPSDVARRLLAAVADAPSD